VKARTDLPMPLPNDNIATAAGQRNRACKASRSCPNDRDGFT
jgi:hypothetical protein